MTNRHFALILLLCLLIAVPVFAVHFAPNGSQIAATAEVTATEVPTAESTAEATATESVTQAATIEVTAEATEALALVGDPVRGKQIFENGLNGAPACSTCHVEKGKTPHYALAPSLAGVYTRAATRVAGQTADQYIVDSILHPHDFIVPGFNPIMYPLFGEKYSSQDIADLLAFLKTL